MKFHAAVDQGFIEIVRGEGAGITARLAGDLAGRARAEVEGLPYYGLVPKGFHENLEFRRRIYRLGSKSVENAKQLWQMCARDPLFFFNTFCISKGTPVVTDRGLVPIESVKLSDRVWDGDSWISHKGVLHQGRKCVIFEYGIKLTPDHKVWTKHGWKIAADRHDRAEVRLPDGYRARWAVPEVEPGRVAGQMRLREGMGGGRKQSSERKHKELRVQEGSMAYSARNVVGCGESPLRYNETAEVYDIINCGPKQAFTVIGEDGRPLLVHNCYTHDPRDTAPCAVLPMITYGFQDVAIMAILRAMTGGKGAETPFDILIEKSREMGASWLCILCFLHQWHFRDMRAYALMSRNSEYVDKTGDPKSLFYKLDFVLDRMPRWLKPAIERSKFHLRNVDNGSTIDGESTTGRFARGGRYSAILMDEFSSMQKDYEALDATGDATPCRVFNSTHEGIATAFYELSRSNMPKLWLHWCLHPLKSRGMTWSETERRPTSPWYMYEVVRRMRTPERGLMSIAQELDIDPEGTASQFYFQDKLDWHERMYCIPCLHQGELHYNEHDLTPESFEELPEGRLKLWVNWGPNGRPVEDRNYIIASDVAVGTGASNSTHAIVDARTKEQIGSFADPHIPPHEHAKMGIVLARWFKGLNQKGAYMVWEANGDGQLFGRTVILEGYHNIYYHRREEGVSVKVSDKPGWWSTPKSKLPILGEHRRALGTGEFIVRDALVIKECAEYVREGDQVLHARSAHAIDPSGAGDNHGDRVIASAIGWYACKLFGDAEKKEPQIIPYGSLAWRRKIRKANEIRNTQSF